ncbi:MAG: hypothetical protein V7785_01040 [Bermanella sp.]
MPDKNNISASDIKMSIGGQLTSSSTPLSSEDRWAFNFNPKSKVANIEVQVNTDNLDAESLPNILTSDLSQTDIEELIQWLMGVKDNIKT